MENRLLSAAFGFARSGLRIGVSLIAFVVLPGILNAAVMVSSPTNVAATIDATARPRLETRGAVVSADVVLVADWVMRKNMHKGHPFIIADKPGSALFAFDADGGLLAKTAALFGAVHSDELTEQQAGKRMEDMVEADKITPAGIFRGEAYKSPSYGDSVRFGRYANTNLLIHRAFNEERIHLLKSAAVSDRRMTWGCINVPPAFMDHVLLPYFSGESAVFVLPEKQSAQSFFAINNDPTFKALAAIMVAYDSFVSRFGPRAEAHIQAKMPFRRVDMSPPAGTAVRNVAFNVKKKIT